VVGDYPKGKGGDVEVSLERVPISHMNTTLHTGCRREHTGGAPHSGTSGIRMKFELT
jgi:hypothetical protein